MKTLRVLLTIFSVTAAAASCTPRYHFDLSLIALSMERDALPSVPVTQDPATIPYLSITFRAGRDYVEKNRSADLFPCNSQLDPSTGNRSPSDTIGGIVTQISEPDNEGAAVFRAIFLRRDLLKFTDEAQSGALRLKQQFRSEGLCFRAVIPEIMYYGESSTIRVDQALTGS